MTMTVATKDPGKRHFYLSIVKSGVRIASCGFCAINPTTLGIAVMAWGLVAAEMIGIAEEL
jgi:hypothetical protein